MAQLKWIGIRPARKAEMISLNEANVNDFGLEGDHYSREKGDRNITIIKAEAIHNVWDKLNIDGQSDPGQMRRNLVIEGLPAGDFKEVEMKIGDEVILTITGDCRPCSRMDKSLGDGGLQAMSGNGGYTARVEQGGKIKIGDQVVHHEVSPKVERYLP